MNDYVNLSAQYLHGSQVSVTAQVSVNPIRPPLLGGKELAPVPMRLRNADASPVQKNNIDAIKAVLVSDKFEIHYLEFEVNTVNILIKNTKFRSTAQALGRIISTLQRFTSDDIKFANISFATGYLQTGTYRIDLQNVTTEQFDPALRGNINSSILAVDSDALEFTDNDEPLTWA